MNTTSQSQCGCIKVGGLCVLYYILVYMKEAGCTAPISEPKVVVSNPNSNLSSRREPALVWNLFQNGYPGFAIDPKYS